MAGDKKETVAVTTDALSELIAARVRDEVAKIMTAKTPDERMTEAMDLQRGKNRPPAPETLIKCKSPITGATFTARCIASRQLPQGRMVELLDYTRPEGWDKTKDQGGLYDGDLDSMRNERGEYSKRYLGWLFKNFLQKDWNELSSKPTTFIQQWRVDAPAAVPAGAVVLTPEKMAKLGITPADLEAV